MGVTAAEAPRENAAPLATIRGGSSRGRRPAPLGFLPQGLHIPDGYDEDYDRPIRRWADPVDRDRIVSFDVFRRPRHGWMVSVAYDKESQGLYSSSGDVFGVTFEYEF